MASYHPASWCSKEGPWANKKQALISAAPDASGECRAGWDLGKIVPPHLPAGISLLVTVLLSGTRVATGECREPQDWTVPPLVTICLRLSFCLSLCSHSEVI